jgi:sugar phosphate isomerase/epimerase
MSPTLRLSIQEQHLRGATLVEKWRHAQQLGFDAIELRGAGDGRFAARLPELRTAAAAGVPMPTVCVEMLHFVGDFDPARRADALAQLKSQLSVMAEIGGRLAMTPASYGMFSTRLPPFVSPRSPAEDAEVLLEAFGALAALAQAEELCIQIGSPALGIAADTYHMNIEEADPPQALMAVGPWLRHVQLSDSNRLEPGAGHIDWAATLHAIASTGYRGELAYECRLSGPVDEVLPISVRRLRQAAAA